MCFKNNVMNPNFQMRPRETQRGYRTARTTATPSAVWLSLKWPQASGRCTRTEGVPTFPRKPTHRRDPQPVGEGCCTAEATYSKPTRGRSSGPAGLFPPAGRGSNGTGFGPRGFLGLWGQMWRHPWAHARGPWPHIFRYAYGTMTASSPWGLEVCISP